MRHHGERRGTASKPGFTLIELMVTVAVIGVLASIALANYRSARARSIDASMKSDLREAIVYLEDYRIQNETLPADLGTFEAATGFSLSPGVEWDQFRHETVGGRETVDLQLRHPQSPHRWHANYPAGGTRIEPR